MRVVAVNTWGLGDAIMLAIPLFALKSLHPELVIDLRLGSATAVELLGQSGIFDSVQSIPVSPRYHILSSITKLRGLRYDIGIVPTEVTPRLGQALKYLGGVGSIIGNSSRGSIWGYTATAATDFSKHRVRANLEILNLAWPGLQLSTNPFPVSPTTLKADAEAEFLSSYPQLICIHPGSGTLQTFKRPNSQLLVEVALSLIRTSKEIGVAIMIGPDESELEGYFRSALQNNSQIRIVTNRSIFETAAILKHSALLVAGDSGLGHVAALVGTPTLTLAGPTHIDRTSPWGPNARILDCCADRRTKADPRRHLEQAQDWCDKLSADKVCASIMESLSSNVSKS